MWGRDEKLFPVFRNNDLIRIVLLGKTGCGKSATGNTILQTDVFKSDINPESVTTCCTKAIAEVDGEKIAVIDTPGLFDTRTDKETTANNITQCIAYASPGPHIFLIVIEVGRFTDEEKKTIQIIQELFGPEADKYSMVLFTHGDRLEEKKIETFVSKSKDLQELVNKCNDQYHVFNNKEKDPSQVTELLKKIRKINEKNGGSFYTTENFQKAEEIIKEEKQRILKESEEQMKQQEEEIRREIEKKYELLLKNTEGHMEKKIQLVEEKQKQIDEKIENLRKEQEFKARQKAEKSKNVKKKLKKIFSGAISGFFKIVGIP